MMTKIRCLLAVLALAGFVTVSYGADVKPNKDVQGKIEIMTVQGYFMDYFKLKVIPEFKKLYPKVDISVVDDANSVLDTRLAAGNPPDLYTGTFGAMPLKYAKAEKLVNLEKYDGYKQIEAKLDPRFSGRAYDGVYYVPWLATTTMMIYNKEIFQKAGLDPNKPPTTIDEFLAYSKKIYSLPSEGKNRYFGAVMWNDALTFGGWYWAMIAPLYYTFNQGKYTLLNKAGTDIVFDRPGSKMSEMLTFCKKVQAYAPDSMGGNKDFFGRNIGMWLQFGYGWKNNFKNAAGGKPMVIGKDVAVAPMPVMKKGDLPYSVFDGRSLMVFHSNPKKEKIVWLLIQFMMSRDDLYIAACKDLNMLPTMTHVEKDPYFRLPDVKPFVTQMKTALPLESEAVADIVQNYILQAYSDAVVTKTLAVDAAIQKAAEKSREELKKY